MTRIATVALSLVLTAAASAAQAPTLRIPRVAQPPEIGDFLDGTPPNGLVSVTDFVQREPGDGVPASQPTTAYFGYDDDHLYVVFVCQDDPSKVRAHYSKRESIFGDDIVGVLLDTFRDQRRAYLFLTNPLGIQLDGVTSETQDDDYSFDTLWHSEGQLTDRGYVVRIAIPFKSLRFSNAAVQTWGIGVGRIIPRNNETSFWPYITRRVAGFAQQLATLEGLERISPGRNMQIIPYGTFTGARFLESDRTDRSTEIRGRVGLDAKMVLGDAVTLDLAANPDFSQVESDEPQVTINQRFEVFFPEKRPFFIENAGFFQMPQQNLFFSRRIADPRLGARATGKAAGWAFAALGIDDQAPGQRLPGADPGHDRHAGIFAGRLQREFRGQSSLGALFTSRDFLSSSNRVASADLRLRLNENWFFTGQATASRTRALDGSERSGPAYDAALSYNSRRASYSLSYADRSPGFRADLGFIQRVDIRRLAQFGRYTRFVNRGALVSYGPWLNALAVWDYGRILQDWELTGGFDANFKGQTGIHVRHSQSMERFAGIEFRQRSTALDVNTEWLQWLSANAGYRAGTAINFFPAPGLAPFLADSRGGSAGVTVRPSGRLRVGTTYLYSQLAGIFDNHILRARADYQFTRELSLRAILDYNGVLPNQSLVALERRKELRADMLVTYLVNPWTAIYVGYTDAYENLGVNPLGSGRRRIGSPTFSTGRQFFVKASYLIRR
jgi:hypothetical protein